MLLLFNNEYSELIRSLLCEEFGSTVGDQLSYSINVKIFEKILLTIARKKTEKSFSERLEIRRELERLLSQLVKDEEIYGINTYEWVVEALLDCEVIKLEKRTKKGTKKGTILQL